MLAAVQKNWGECAASYVCYIFYCRSNRYLISCYAVLFLEIWENVQYPDSWRINVYFEMRLWNFGQFKPSEVLDIMVMILVMPRQTIDSHLRQLAGVIKVSNYVVDHAVNFWS